MQRVRIGIVGLGNNTRNRHVPGFLAIDGVEIVSVCNRSRESTARAAEEFQIPRTFEDWRALVEDPDLDAVMIGTWPYMHCPITLHALAHGKHVLTEARMAADLAEARQMHRASQDHPELVTQIVPSPFGLRAGGLVAQLLEEGYLGELRGFGVRGLTVDFASMEAPLHWRQQREFSGDNILALGILHETLIRWIPDPQQVCAQAQCVRPEATVPDGLQILSVLPSGAQGVYQLSGVAHHGGELLIELFGSRGTLHYGLQSDRLLGAQVGDPALEELEVPADLQGGWRVEEDFVTAIRGGARPQLTDFETGVRYMQFTDAVQRSLQTQQWVRLCDEEVGNA